jgi:hypothetical protein
LPTRGYVQRAVIRDALGCIVVAENYYDLQGASSSISLEQYGKVERDLSPSIGEVRVTKVREENI